MKVCTKCKVEKALDGFGNNKLAKDGLRTVCKVCRSILAKAYFKAYDKDNRERIAIRRKAYYAANP